MPIFEWDQMVVVSELHLADRYEVVKQAFLGHPNALEATAYRQPIGREGGVIRTVIPEGHEGETWRMPVLEVDEDFLDVFDITIVEGRKFDSSTFPTDASGAFILNETAVDRLGWNIHALPASDSAAIGKMFEWVDEERDIRGSVIGVISDFHYDSFHSKIKPAAMVFRNKQFYNLGVRIRPEGFEETIAFFEDTWKRFLPDAPFRYAVWDQDFERIYQEQRRSQDLTMVSSGIAILLACMGLLGLVSNSVEERRKEIGIRKTLGATVAQIVLIVSHEFAVLVVIASILAVPVAWLVLQAWLDHFAYRTSLGLGLYLIGGIAALLISQLTVSYHAVRAARMNPVDAIQRD